MSIFREAVKEGTFLDHYLQYMSPLETPLAYDFWCGLWLISNAIGRRIIVDRPKAPVFLNLYMVLCADAGTTRKSSAIRLCEAVFRAAGFDQSSVTITGSATPEKLREQLAIRSAESGSGVGSIIVSELVTFLGKEQYTVAMPGLLTDLYDCPALRDYSRMSSAPVIVRNAYLTFAAATTSSWLIRAINPDVIEGGFTSRCLFIIEERRKRMVPWPEDDNPIKPDLLARSLLHIRNQADRWSSKGIGLTVNAKARFVQWYERRDNSDANDPFVASFEAREDHHILRLAALLAANDDSWLIDVFHINHAIKIVTHHKNSASAIFGANKESVKLVSGIDSLRQRLLEAGELGIGQSELLFKVRNRLKARELEFALAVMHEMEMVQKFELPTAGRKKTVWRATNKILSRDLNRLVMDKLNAK
jgi:Protein of unknown function (DUF3987)